MSTSNPGWPTIMRQHSYNNTAGANRTALTGALQVHVDCTSPDNKNITQLSLQACRTHTYSGIALSVCVCVAKHLGNIIQTN
jgi:hypothetical protein